MNLSNKFNELQKKWLQRRLDKKLLSAATANNHFAVRGFLASGANPNARSLFFNRTALMIAARASRAYSSNIIGYLLQNGADILTQDRLGNTALHHAAKSSWFNRDEVTKILLYAGADPKVLNKFNLNAHNIARNHYNRDVIRIIDHYKNPGKLKEFFFYVTDGLSRWGAHNALMSVGYDVVFKSMIKTHKIDVNIQDANGMTPLNILAQRGWEFEENLSLIKTLLDRGADPEIPDKNGVNAIQNSYWHGNPQITALLEHAVLERKNPPVKKSLTEEELKNSIFLKEDLVIGKPLKFKRKIFGS